MTTCEPVSDGGSEADDGSLTLFAADSLASPSPSRGRVKRKTINGGSGRRSRTSFASYDRGTSSWKTFQVCLDGEWETWSGTWPASGMTRSGIACPLPPSVPHTYETGSSSLPTPSAVSYGTNQGGGAGRTGPERPSLETMARHDLWPTPKASAEHYGRPRENDRGDLQAAVRMWPTPVAQDTHRSPEAYLAMRERIGRDSVSSLAVAAQMWPTPTASDGSGGRVSSDPGGTRPSGKKKYITLGTAVNHWPTPQARDYRTGQPSRVGRPGRQTNLNDLAAMWPTPTAACVDMDTMERQRYSREQLAQMRDDGEPYVTQTTGMLNPAWVEALMGYPPGWTET